MRLQMRKKDADGVPRLRFHLSFRAFEYICNFEQYGLTVDRGHLAVVDDQTPADKHLMDGMPPPAMQNGIRRRCSQIEMRTANFSLMVGASPNMDAPVSYTHLTLPTNREV